MVCPKQKDMSIMFAEEKKERNTYAAHEKSILEAKWIRNKGIQF